MTGSKTTISDLVYQGSLTPTWFGSLMNEWSYKNFTLTAMISGKAGHYFKKPTIQYNGFFAGAAGHGDYALRWKIPGDENFTTVPSLVYPTTAARDNFYASSEAVAERADHIRLEFIRLSYDRSLKKAAFRSMQIFLHAANLGILWRANDKGIDPDYVTGYPQPKTFTAGLVFNY